MVTLPRPDDVLNSLDILFCATEVIQSTCDAEPTLTISTMNLINSTHFLGFFSTILFGKFFSLFLIKNRLGRPFGGRNVFVALVCLLWRWPQAGLALGSGR